MTSSTRSSPTSSPAAIVRRTWAPSFVWFWTCQRKMLPTLRWTRSKSRASSPLWVPFPLPCAPMITYLRIATPRRTLRSVRNNLSRPADHDQGHRPVGLHRQPDVLHLEVLLDPLAPALTAEAGGLDAAKRRSRVGDDAGVEPDQTRFQALRHRQSATEVGRVRIGDQPELGAV